MTLFPKSSKNSKIDLDQISDEHLVNICKQELPETTTAYKILIGRYEDLIYNTCLKILGNPQDAEEVAQDTFVQIFHKLHQFQGRSTFKTWLYRIVHNYCKNKISKQIRHRKRQSALQEFSSFLHFYLPTLLLMLLIQKWIQYTYTPILFNQTYRHRQYTRGSHLPNL